MHVTYKHFAGCSTRRELRVLLQLILCVAAELLLVSLLLCNAYAAFSDLLQTRKYPVTGLSCYCVSALAQCQTCVENGPYHTHRAAK